MTAIVMHKDYTAVSGQPRPMDSNHHVPGDTPCLCGGIAWYHGAEGVGCDDCDCEEFVAAAHESSGTVGNGDYTLVDPPYSGAYQFLDTTWSSVTGLPGIAADYPPSVQDAAAFKLYSEEGWSPWQTRSVCGV